jgi:tyrosine-specific transport protein
MVKIIRRRRRQQCVFSAATMKTTTTLVVMTFAIASATLRFALAFLPARIIQPVSSRTKPITYGSSNDESSNNVEVPSKFFFFDPKEPTGRGRDVSLIDRIESGATNSSSAAQSKSKTDHKQDDDERAALAADRLKNGKQYSTLQLADAKHDGEEHHEESVSLFQNIINKVGKIDESRYSDSNIEYLNGSVPRLFSNIHYTTITESSSDGKTITTKLSVQHKPTNWVASSSLLCGTALGSGLLTLPQAIEAAGYLPTIVATLVAWAYMTISALLTSELLINRCGETGRVRNVGLLELYTSYLGESGGKLAGLGFLLVSYLVMGVYLSEGGDTLRELLEMTVSDGGGIGDLGSTVTTATTMLPSNVGDISRAIVDNPFLPRALFAALMGSFLATAAKFDSVQRAVTHFFLPVTLLGFAAAMTVGLPTADFGALFSLDNQHPELVLSAFPLLFMSWTYHGVMPRVVYDLEGDKVKITKAIVGGSTTALLMYLTWNAVVLGNVLGDGNILASTATAASAILGDDSISTIQQSSGVLLRDMLAMQGDEIATASTIGSNPIALLQGQSLQTYVALASELGVVTSLIGVVLGFVNEFYDVIGKLPRQAYGPKEDNKWQVALLTLLPPAIVSVLLGASSGSYDYNFEILDYTGIFGGSVLFLILPALMVWQNRYGDDARPLTVKPMFPLGKITLGSLYKAAGTLIVEQGLEKLGVFEFIKELFESRTT